MGTERGPETVPCPLCRRPCPSAILERHHLRTRRRDKKAVEMICKECHRTVHGLFANPELRDPARELDSLEGLLEHEQFQSALRFIRKVPPGTSIRMRLSGHARRRGR
jgi:5-methylcytosine-specific restriction protein A